MIDFLVHLPLVSYWLPVIAALAVATPLYWLFRPRRSLVIAPAGAASSATVDGAVPAEPPVLPGHPPEQRRSFRRAGNSIGLYYKLPEQKEPPRQAAIVDRSMGGLCVLMHEAFPVGTILSVRPTTADDIVPWVELEVCMCRKGDDCFEVGCRFVKTPPYSILLLFG
jgi:hypothetical protein